MPGLWIDILLFLLIYTLLIFLIKWRSSYRRPRNKNSDGEGGIPIEFNWEPDLDLPPGVTLPDSGPSLELEEVEEEMRRKVELV